MSARIQKILAGAGIGSRRAIDALIEAGRITVNGQPARPGDRITGQERVAIDGRPVRLAATEDPAPRALAYHKPIGEISTRKDSDGRPSVFERLPRLRGQRWVAVGRLDINSAGLMIFTTDGALAHALMHPSQGVEREYAVRVLGELRPPTLKRLLEGVQLADGTARFERIEPGGGTGANRWYRVTLREGRKREVRRLFEALGCRVNRLLRVRYGSVELARDLRPGEYRPLSARELAALYRAVGMAPEPDPEQQTKRRLPSSEAAKPRRGRGSGSKPGARRR